jgi:hypothetical protein
MNLNNLTTSYRRLVLPAILIALGLATPLRMLAQDTDEDDTGLDYATQVQNTYPGGGQLQFDLRASTTCGSGQAVLELQGSRCISDSLTRFTSTSKSFLSSNVASDSQMLALVNPHSYSASVSAGFTVAVSLDTTVSVGTTQTVFAIYPNTPAGGTTIRFALMRDNQGFWYTGKPNDGPGPNIYYLNRAWDPVSPCVTAGICTSDTIYVTFLSNGQIILDEIAVFSASKPNRVSWQTGSLNYGYPVSGFQSGGLVTPPSAGPLFYDVGYVGIGTLPSSLFPTTASGNNGFPAASLTRVAVWAGGTGGSGKNIAALRAFVLADQQAVIPAGFITSYWVPCNSGSFQNPTNSIATGYSPQSISTSCNVNPPDPPTFANFYSSSENLWFYCNAPAYTAGSPVTSYLFSLNGGAPASKSTCAFESSNMPLANGQTFTLAAYAVNAAGQSTALTTNLTIGAPSPPTFVKFFHSGENLWFSCNVPSTAGSSPITSYQFSLNGGSPVTASNCQFESRDMLLITGKQYTINAYAVNTAGRSIPLTSSLIIK